MEITMRAMTVMSALLLAVMSCAAHAQTTSSATGDTVMTIDGAKNPELVPQWNVWAAGLRYLAKDDTEKLPTVVLQALTQEQSVVVMKAAVAAATFDHECGMRALQVGREQRDEKLDVVESKIDEAAMMCRRHTLEVRDKLLAELPPAGAAALTGWVESLKAGMKISLRKSRLKAFSLPE